MSINQNANASALPNFRNLGILLRILVIVDGMCLAAALLKTSEPLALMEELIDLSSLVQPILMLSLLVLAAANDWLHRLRYRYAIAALVALELAITTAVYFLGVNLFIGIGALERYWIFTLLITGILIGYFDLRGRALSPALTEARLQALQARIRPHFLFNSINAVLSLMRQEPRRAEQALEDLADLFRVLMADNRQLTPIAREVELAKQYLSIEQLRLGDRLRVEWDVDAHAGGRADPAAGAAAVAGKRRVSRHRAAQRARHHQYPHPPRRRTDAPDAAQSVPSRRATTMRATAWRSPTSASGWRCISTRKPVSRRWRPTILTKCAS